MRILDKLKLFAAVGVFALALLLPLVVLMVGWSERDLRTGAIGALITLAIMLVLIAVLFVTVRRHNWFSASMPLLMGFLYSLLPDVVVGPVDDAVTLSGGALLSFYLWYRKQNNVPRWTILPVIGAVIYTVLGGWLPGPIDELLVYIVTGASALAGLRKARLDESATRPADFVEGEFVDLPEETPRK